MQLLRHKLRHGLRKARWSFVPLVLWASGCLAAVPAIVFAPPAHYSISTTVNRLCSGDFNGDQRLDLAALTGEGTQVTLWTNDGRGEFIVSTNHPTAGTARVIAAGDVDNNGKLDLVTENYPADSISAFLGRGDGTFERRDSGLTVNNVSPGLALGDFNGDGWLDAALGSYDMRIALGNGNGFFSVFTNYPSALVYAVAVADLSLGRKARSGHGELFEQQHQRFPGPWRRHVRRADKLQRRLFRISLLGRCWGFQWGRQTGFGDGKSIQRFGERAAEQR
jgi:hypothetical protein